MEMTEIMEKLWFSVVFGAEIGFELFADASHGGLFKDAKGLAIVVRPTRLNNEAILAHFLLFSRRGAY